MNAQLHTIESSPRMKPAPLRALSAVAFAPACVGNVAVGFDILGHSMAGAGDRAEVRRIDEPVVRIAAIEGCLTELPRDPQRNTAGMALISLRKALGLHHGFELSLHKGIALGSGMAGSAASCVAALVAANALLEKPLPREALYGFAMDGEAVASGGRHGDNWGHSCSAAWCWPPTTGWCAYPFPPPGIARWCTRISCWKPARRAPRWPAITR
jgi:Homoserine kinase